VDRVASSFAWPFRGPWQSRWVGGIVSVALLPVAFIPLLGYSVAATRAAFEHPDEGPPPWVLSTRLLAEGFWTALVLVLVTIPFALALNPLADLIDGAHILASGDRAMSRLLAFVAAGFILALPWGLVLLLLLPHATLRFALTGRPRDLFDVPASLRGVSRDFATWNVAAAAMVTAWAIGLACAGLLCVGLVPGIFYAILVSAHATAAIRAQAPNPSAR
jgi:hypothetical protein